MVTQKSSYTDSKNRSRLDIAAIAKYKRLGSSPCPSEAEFRNTFLGNWKELSRKSYNSINFRISDQFEPRDAVFSSLIHKAISRYLRDKPKHNVRSRIKTTYDDYNAIAALIGDRGKILLNKISDFIRDQAEKKNWPLVEIKVRHIKDPEIMGWEYVLILLIFETDFDVADGYLNNLYNKIDIFISKLSKTDQEIVQRNIYFDTGVTISQD